ncbi:MAG: hypothetical protein VXZ82_25125 [Planctomycetota bacterium]|nr:hypothetical protein [Planctomycetota bacterium]
MSQSNPVAEFVAELRESVPVAASTDAGPEGDSLIGVFQAFRPDGLPEFAMLESVPGGSEFRARIQCVYDAVGTGQRSDNMKDAFFVVRHPPQLQSNDAQKTATDFVKGALELALQTGVENTFELPEIRILEGKPPKHPKNPNEKSKLLHLFESELPAQIDALFAPGSLGNELSEALYFVACDRWLRDFLRWPMLQPNKNDLNTSNSHCVDSYFQLWRHGVKFRIFSNNRIDFYLPVRADGSLINAGAFAGGA